MSYITKYGSFWGMLPQTSGRIFWVASAASYTVEGATYTASDGNDGLSPERAFRTIDYAVGQCTANVSDVIVLLPGAHSSAATVTLDVAGVHITGIPADVPHAKSRRNSGGRRNKATIVNTATAGIIFTVTALDVEISHLTFLPVAAGGRGISITPTLSTSNRCYVHDCTFQLAATASVTTYGITVPAGVTTDVLEDVLVSSCYFSSGSDTTTGANGGGVNIIGTAHGFTIENSTFELKGTQAWAAAIDMAPISVGALLGIVIRDNEFLNPTATTTVITTAVRSVTATTISSVSMLRNYVGAGTDGATAVANNVICFAENYLLGVASPFGALFGNV
jgi:hypothetical protein